MSLRSLHGQVGRFIALGVVAALLGLGALVIAGSDAGEAAFPGTDGRIVYAQGGVGHSSIFSADADGSDATRLTAGPEDSGPTYSADGSRIAFEHEDGIAVMDADGSTQRELVAGEEASSESITYQENYKDPESPRVVPIVKIDTHTERWLVYGHPSFSPDGSRLAVSESHGTKVEREICAVYAINEPDCYQEQGEGPETYFHEEKVCDECVSHIVAIDAASGAIAEAVTLGSPAYEDFDPTYALDGKIAFDRVEPNSHYGAGPQESKIFVVPAPGQTADQITPGPKDLLPDFSPDGSQIVFKHGEAELGFVGVGGGALTLRPIPGAVGSTSHYVESPIFSPDGSELLLARTDKFAAGESKTALYEIPVAGSALTEVVEGAEGPGWQPVPPTPPPPPNPPSGVAPTQSSQSSAVVIERATAKSRKGRIELDRQNRATIGTITCGSSACNLKPLGSRLLIGKVRISGGPPRRPRCFAKVKLKSSLGSHQSAPVAVLVGGADCLEGLRTKGKGSLVVKVQATDALGGREVLALHSTLVLRPAHRAVQGDRR